MIDRLARLCLGLLGLLLIVFALVVGPELFSGQGEGDLYIGGTIGTDEDAIERYCVGLFCQALNRTAVEEAAQPLLDRGATIAVFLDGDGGADSFYRQLGTQGYIDSEESSTSGPFVIARGRTNLISIYVSVSLLGRDYSEIAYGKDWSDQLTPHVQTILDEQLAPSVNGNLYTSAFVDTLAAIEGHLAAAPVTEKNNLLIIADIGGIVVLLVVLVVLGVLKFQQLNTPVETSG